MKCNKKQTISFFGLALTSVDVLAHTNGSHDMGFVEGLFHLMTQPSHVWLLAPAIVLVLGYHFRKRVIGKIHRD